MKHFYTFAKGAWLGVAVVGLCVGPGARPATAEQSEILRITVGKETVLSPVSLQGSASLAVSRTGVVAAFYPKPGTGGQPNEFYRTSTDRGATWGEEMPFPPPTAVGLRKDGALFLEGQVKGVNQPGGQKATWKVFSDDFAHYETGTASVSLPQAALQTRWLSFWPVLNGRAAVQLANGDLLAIMYGDFVGDTQYRTMIVRSSDLGKTWQYHATVAYDPKDPDPSLAGGYSGYCEPSLTLLPDGRLLCAMRIQGCQYHGEYRPLYMSWSDPQGKTWSKPTPTNPHLMNIMPTLAVLDNGVVACEYGRPGFHVAFSTDNGHTWRDRISFSDLTVDLITGQFHVVKVGPNRLAAIGNDATGTKVWPIDVERVKVSPAQMELTGRVLDQAGRPIVGAKVELGPNRYTADFWMDSDKLDTWKRGAIPVNPPVLGYRSISKEKGYPTATTDASGQFEFKSVKLVEYVLTVEADGYAPQWRHINVRPEPKTRSQQFRLKAGRSVHGRVMDWAGKPVGGACVVLNKWHIHADSEGFFHWAIDAPAPNEVTVKAYKRYIGDYATFEQKLSLSQIEEKPIVLRQFRAGRFATP